ncbi:MAG: DUF6456 domain-containing protein [Ahrensia sp.]|nr:DUF6456 domain-containing protein [Ahrensia sp.]
MSGKNGSGADLKVLRLLLKGPATLSEIAPRGDGRPLLLLDNGCGKQICSPATMDALSSGGAILRDGQCVTLTEPGEARLARENGSSSNDVSGFAGQHRVLVQRRLQADDEKSLVSVNELESPLASLQRRKDGHGQPWISDAAFQAGEVLRRDFTFAGMMKRVSASWDFSGTRRNNRGAMGAGPDITDTALDARRRLDQASAVLGPELTGVVVDFCCFLKGLELIERERKWPQRSAKLMLRTALDLLARHYKLEATGPRSAKMRNWQASAWHT